MHINRQRSGKLLSQTSDHATTPRLEDRQLCLLRQELTLRRSVFSYGKMFADWKRRLCCLSQIPVLDCSFFNVVFVVLCSFWFNVLYDGVFYNRCQCVLVPYRLQSHFSMDMGNGNSHWKMHTGQARGIDQTPVVSRKGTDKQTLWPPSLMFAEYTVSAQTEQHMIEMCSSGEGNERGEEYYSRVCALILIVEFIFKFKTI